MSFLFVFALFFSNFVFLVLFSSVLLFLYHRKRAQMDRFFHSQLRKEQIKLEELTTQLLKTSDLLFEKMDDKEKKLKELMGRLVEQVAAVRVQKVPVIERKTSVSITHPQPTESQELHRKEYFDQNSKFKEIYFLADRGVSLVDIAQKCGKTKGEVELVLSLRKAKLLK